MIITIIILVVICIALAVYLVGIYNRLVALKNQFENAFSQIEIQLKRRYDLIPNLIEVAKGYLKHERETLEAVTEARNNASSALKELNSTNQESLKNLVNAESSLNGALGKLNFVMEAYPDLKANENMLGLHEELTTTENKVSFARQAYNDSVMEYNTYRQSFPQILIANSFGHAQDANLLEFEDSQKFQAPPEVKF